MPEIYTILTPLPQLDMQKPIPKTVPNPLLEEGFCFSPMTPPLYRSLVNLAKEHDCHDDIIMLLQEAKAIFSAEVPCPHLFESKPIMSCGYYSIVADAVLRRLFDCFLLYDYVPKAFRRSFWFIAKGSPNKIDTKSIKLPELTWQYYDDEIKFTEPVSIFPIMCVLFDFKKLSPILGINKLKDVFTDKQKQKGYLSAANKYALEKTEEVVKAKYGPDATILNQDQTIDGATNSFDEEKSQTTRISPKLGGKWILEGYSYAYFNEVNKINRKLYKETSGQRFIRAFQFFTNACRLENPHRFAALMASLEALFCTSPREITFQLSSRLAWFLNPDDLSKRKEVFTKIKDLYDIRSKIVHGGKYSIGKIENTVDELEDLVRKVFQRILSDENIYEVFFNRDQNVCNQYLDDVNLG